MDFARRRQRQAALGSINLEFIAAIICLRIFGGYREARGNHRWAEKAPLNQCKKRNGKKGQKSREKKETKGKCNRGRTIYRTLNRSILTNVRSGNGKHAQREWTTPGFKDALEINKRGVADLLAAWFAKAVASRLTWRDLEWLKSGSQKAGKKEDGIQARLIVNWPRVTSPIEEIINLPWYLLRLSLLRQYAQC